MARLVFCDDVNKKINGLKPKKIPIIRIDGRRKIVDKVKTLSKDAHMEIFYFLKKKINEEYTLNQNGVFVNLNNVDNDTLYVLKKMVDFYSKNEKKLKESYLQRYCNKKEEVSEPDSDSDSDSDEAKASTIIQNEVLNYRIEKEEQQVLPPSLMTPHKMGFSPPYDASKASLALPARASDVDEDLPCCTSSTHRGGSKAHLITLSYDSDSDSDYSEEDSEEDSEDSEGSEDSGDSDESDSDEDVKTNTKMKTKTKANK